MNFIDVLFYVNSPDINTFIRVAVLPPAQTLTQVYSVA